TADKSRVFTLFATHYFELTSLPGQFPACASVHLDASEYGEQLVFLHSVKQGPADRSYGIQVARLAGVPAEVIHEARLRLQSLEASATRQPATKASPSPQLGLFGEHPLLGELRTLEVDALSPRAALDVLYRLKQQATES